MGLYDFEWRIRAIHTLVWINFILNMVSIALALGAILG